MKHTQPVLGKWRQRHYFVFHSLMLYHLPKQTRTICFLSTNMTQQGLHIYIYKNLKSSLFMVYNDPGCHEN